jgi:Flp pilus assembly protein protease CpaA
MFWPALLILLMLASLYDLRTGKVPNWVTLPLLCAGLVAHFPGTQEAWFLCLVLYLAWHLRWMAAGDAKLWMALLWALPPGNLAMQPLVFFIIFFSTGLLQILFRKFMRQPLTGVRSPGAWRTIPFMLWSLYVH